MFFYYQNSLHNFYNFSSLSSVSPTYCTPFPGSVFSVTFQYFPLLPISEKKPLKSVFFPCFPVVLLLTSLPCYYIIVNTALSVVFCGNSSHQSTNHICFYCIRPIVIIFTDYLHHSLIRFSRHQVPDRLCRECICLS